MSDNGKQAADWDLDGWISGTTGITHSARVYQKGHLLAKLDELERRLELAKGVPDSQRGTDDDSPKTLQAQWEQVAEELLSSSILVYIQDRTEGRRQEIRERLNKQKVDSHDTITLHVLADAIVKVETPDGRTREFPDGFPVEKLREIRDRGGDNVLTASWATFRKVISEEPDVSAPLSRRSSSRRAGSM